jgi:hypothetical protein
MDLNELEKLESISKKGRNLFDEIFQLEKQLSTIEKYRDLSLTIQNKHTNIQLQKLSEQEMDIITEIVRNRLIDLKNSFTFLDSKI